MMIGCAAAITFTGKTNVCICIASQSQEIPPINSPHWIRLKWWRCTALAASESNETTVTAWLHLDVFIVIFIGTIFTESNEFIGTGEVTVCSAAKIIIQFIATAKPNERLRSAETNLRWWWSRKSNHWTWRTSKTYDVTWTFARNRRITQQFRWWRWWGQRTETVRTEWWLIFTCWHLLLRINHSECTSQYHAQHNQLEYSDIFVAHFYCRLLPGRCSIWKRRKEDEKLEKWTMKKKSIQIKRHERTGKRLKRANTMSKYRLARYGLQSMWEVHKLTNDHHIEMFDFETKLWKKNWIAAAIESSKVFVSSYSLIYPQSSQVKHPVPFLCPTAMFM